MTKQWVDFPLHSILCDWAKKHIKDWEPPLIGEAFYVDTAKDKVVFTWYTKEEEI